MRSNKPSAPPTHPLHPNSWQNRVSLTCSLQAPLLCLLNTQQPDTVASSWPFTFAFGILLTWKSTLWQRTLLLSPSEYVAMLLFSRFPYLSSFFFFLHAAPNFLRVTWMPVSSCTFSAKLSHILLITCPYFVFLQVISMTALCITTSSSWRGSRASHCWCSLLSRSSTTSRKPEQGFSSRDALPLDPTRLHIHKLAAQYRHPLVRSLSALRIPY